jgi:hypothetical protein
MPAHPALARAARATRRPQVRPLKLSLPLNLIRIVLLLALLLLAQVCFGNDVMPSILQVVHV